MKSAGEFYLIHGEGSIGDILGSHAEVVERFPCALLTSVDSLRNLGDWKMPPEIALTGKMVGNALSLWTPTLVAVARRGVLCGFDEVWFLRQPPSRPPPADAWLVGPRDVLTDEIGPAIAWMRENECNLAMGDGIGINAVTGNRGTALAIERAIRSITKQ